MLCQKCGVRQATLKISPFIGDSKFDMHLCSVCYDTIRNSVGNNITFTIANFPTAFVQKRPVCKQCGTTADSFSSTAIVGCAYCYEELSSVVTPYIRRVQRGFVHKGKRPDTRYAELKAEMDRAIAEGRMEDAEAIGERMRLWEEQG